MTISPRPELTRAADLLGAAGLPASDLAGLDLRHFFYAGSADAPVGLVGLEIAAPDALLRSLVVDTTCRGSGVGSRLVTHAERHARAHGVTTGYLLTTTAEAFFSSLGYTQAARTEAPAAISATREFAYFCPASAVFMRKILG
jgi:N-acetylglutamate synthase-like GNAT family acetyltransferase